uniref:uncharacterized protein LOC103788404 n=1 Tax=Callithrix jacchus TaxID=9483 RepID=UPI00159D976E|nr:uncharacterized protein LOC103788404 [Callithrix jacchus]
MYVKISSTVSLAASIAASQGEHAAVYLYAKPALSSSSRTQRRMTARGGEEDGAGSRCAPHCSPAGGRGLPAAAGRRGARRGRIHAGHPRPCSSQRAPRARPLRTHSRPCLTSVESLAFRERA